MEKPNILFYFTDQQRADSLHCYGNPLSLSPATDRLSSLGTKFSNAFTCQPVCGPARACLQSGRYATEIGCYVNNIQYPTEHKTLGHLFSEYGYSTAYVGKWHLASGQNADYMCKAVPANLRGGYEFWRASDVLEFTSNGYGGYVFDENNQKICFEGFRADKITDFALEYLNQELKQPFFLTVSHIEPHQQNDAKRVQGPKGSCDKYSEFVAPDDLKRGVGVWEEDYPNYLGCVSNLDYNLNRIVDKLIEKNLFENTVIFIFSDHGCHFGTREGEYKRSCHDSSTHIPVIIHGREFSFSKQFENVVSLIDIPPTALKCANIPIPNYMQGKPLQTLFEEDLIWDDCVFIQISESQVGRAIRTKQYTYSVYDPHKNPITDKNSVHYISRYLYDNYSDKAQQTNLIHSSKHTHIKEQLKKQLIEKIKQYENLEVQIY